jgi:hypothetical protein
LRIEYAVTFIVGVLTGLQLAHEVTHRTSIRHIPSSDLGRTPVALIWAGGLGFLSPSRQMLGLYLKLWRYFLPDAL